MPRLALCDDFVADLISLQRPVQKEVNDAIQMFRSLTVPQLHASKGMHLEKLEGSRDKEAHARPGDHLPQARPR
jgi:hypothetical protein